MGILRHSPKTQQQIDSIIESIWHLRSWETPHRETPTQLERGETHTDRTSPNRDIPRAREGEAPTKESRDTSHSAHIPTLRDLVLLTATPTPNPYPQTGPNCTHKRKGINLTCTTGQRRDL